MLQHLAAGNGAVTHHISVIVARGIVDAEYDRLRPYFEAAGVLMDIDDAIKGARRRAVMTRSSQQCTASASTYSY